MNVMMFFRILFLVTFFFAPLVSALEWQSATLDRVIDSEHFVTREGTVVKILGYDGPDPDFPSPNERGIARSSQRLLKLLLSDAPMQLLPEGDTRSGMRSCHVKLDGGQRLAEFLIERGYGRAATTGVVHFSNTIERAEAVARAAGVGIWGESSLQHGLGQLRQIAGRRSRQWQKKFGQHCAGSSIGLVGRVFGGDLIEMEDGVRVRLIGLQVPRPDDARHGYACFGTAARDHLSALILGKKVRLEPDRTEVNEAFEIPRYVWLLGDPKKFDSDELINQKMIVDGYARSDWRERDDRRKTDFETLQAQVYADPRGAWVKCAREILKK